MKSSIKKLEELVNKRLDGLLSSAEQEELDALLIASEKARQYAMQMETMHERMSQTEFKHRQIDISRQVMAQIEKINHEKIMKKSHLTKSFTLASNQMLKYAAMLLIGLLLGSSVTYVLTSGTLTPDKELSKGLMSSHQSGSTYFNGSNWQIHANYTMIDKEINLFVSVKSVSEIQVKMQMDPTVYKIINAQCQGCSTSPKENLYSGNFLFSAAGETVYKIQTTYQPGIYSPVQVEVMQDNGLLFQGEIIIR
jgi:hypothetical protein